MTLRTRLTDRLGIRHPILSAPMAFASGGALAAAVSSAGGLGLIGGGYGDAGWLEQQFAAAGNQRIGAGFITWSLAKSPHLLDLVLDREPAAVMLSFGDPRPFASAIRAAGAVLICQVQTLAHAREALQAGAEVIVAQGAEAGGHGQTRGTLTLVPEVADLLARESPQTVLVAAGGIADGRGLAAALMLGADGVLIGSRFWASKEALVHPQFQAKALEASGDDTVRQRASDIARGFDWPRAFTARVLDNPFVREWEGREAEHRAAAETQRAAYQSALANGDADRVGVFVGEAVGMIHDVPSAAEIVERIVEDAARRLERGRTGERQAALARA
jgi:nitronate monooxygenase